MTFLLCAALVFYLSGCTSPVRFWGSEGIYELEDFGDGRVYEYDQPVTFKVWVGCIKQTEEKPVKTAYLVITWGCRDDTEELHSTVVEINDFTNEKYQVSKKWYKFGDYNYSQYIEVTLDMPEESLREQGDIDIFLCGSYKTLEDGNFTYEWVISIDVHGLSYWKTGEGLKIKNLV